MSICTKGHKISLHKIDEREKFWLEDITQLFSKGRYTKFIPRYEMTRDEQLNAISRFAFYLIILFLLFDYYKDWLAIPIIILIIVIVIYNFNKMDDKGKEKELDRILTQRKENKMKEMELDIKELTHDGEEPEKLLDIQKEDPNYGDRENKAIFPEDGDYQIEAGRYDAEGKLQIGPKPLVPKTPYHEPEIYYSAEEIQDYQKGTCRRPTEDNPFMNPTFTDFNNGDPPAACNVDDEDINDEMRVNFNHDLFRDVDEIWERENSQRNFYTVPNTAVPNNQKEFALWLYGGSNRYPDCKTDGNCLRYEDLRWKRGNYKR